MTPEELAERHPKLFHVTFSSNVGSILRWGLHSSCALVACAEVDQLSERIDCRHRRTASLTFRHTSFGNVTLNDNVPLKEPQLLNCLDPDLEPSDWFEILNQRVFFWVCEERARGFVGARAARGVEREILIFDTLALVKANYDRIEICPINSGDTTRRPPLRGRSTFTPLREVEFAQWRRQRGNLTNDKIKEVTVVDGVPDVARYLCDQRKVERE